ncbi:VOC family protein [Algoriphagus marincola]|uniref:VOC family protein n=1 Tax=Algoriphagus marincola TaxID=264027 RepID=UPI000415C8AA|nr:VOC family protein [Algoriphagus marincola]
MTRNIGKVAILVKDYDEAIQWYTGKLNFKLIEDKPLPDQGDKRWVTIAPDSYSTFQLLLAKASTEHQSQFIGNQSGGRVFLFLYTTDFSQDYSAFLSNGVEFIREPESHSYGRVAVFKDLYGNLWDLIEPIIE